uniref:Protein tincar n=1 Tax=Panagrellus redivivus TaxID=6233 RepID=A0A7E4W7X1_PANRE
MGCIFRARLNSLWSVWYTVIFLLIQIYLIYLGFERYRLYTEMKWPHGAYPHLWLTVYVALYAACIPLCLLFFAFGFFKSGNIPGDNETLGFRTERILEITGSTRKSCCLRSLKSLWLHAPPLPQTIHIFLAVFQLFAQQVMLAQLYRFGFINSGDFMNTELDFLYQRARQLALNLPMGDTRLQGFRITTEELTGSPIAPNLLPILMHARLFGISLEFVNFVVALIAFSIAYSAVFWRVNKAFVFWFSFHLIFYIADVIFTYLEFCILLRIQETNHHSIRPIGLGQHLAHARPKILYHPLSIIAFFWATFLLMFIGPILLYCYGYQKYFTAVSALRNRNRERAQATVTDDYGEIRRRQLDDPGDELCCSGYCPTMISIIYLLVIIGVKGPTMGGILNLIVNEHKPIILTSIIVHGLYLSTWILIWFVITLKQEWQFRILHQVHEFLSIQNAHKLGFGTIVGKAPSELKNALIMMQGDHMYVTDDPLAKQSLMRHALKTNTQEEVYWLRANQSPTARRPPPDEGKSTQEMTRLLGPGVRRQSSGTAVPIGNQSPSMQQYQQNRSLRGLPPQGPLVGYNEEQMMNNFGTMQQVYGQGRQALQTATLGRASTQNLHHQPESYASINKNMKPGYATDTIQRRGSQTKAEFMETATYGNNATYATYSRAPQNRIYQPSQPAPITSAGIYDTYNGALRQTSEPLHPAQVKASPLLSEKKIMSSMGEPSQYQRTGNMSSFSNQRPTVNAVNRLPPSGTPPQWNNLFKPTLSASSSQQDSCFTPTSSISSKQTPTAGSPNNPTRYNGQTHAGIYGDIRAGSEPHHQNTGYNSGTLTKASTSLSSVSKQGPPAPPFLQ